MAVFLSTYKNKVDKKGRVSVPASFRSILAEQAGTGAEPPHEVVLYKSLQHDCLEGCSRQQMEAFSRDLDASDMDWEDKEQLATAIFGSSIMLTPDGDGRITLPADLAEFAGITDRAAFFGCGATFQIWNPDSLAEHQEAARAKARAKGMSLRMLAGRKPGVGGL